MLDSFLKRHLKNTSKFKKLFYFFSIEVKQVKVLKDNLIPILIAFIVALIAIWASNNVTMLSNLTKASA